MLSALRPSLMKETENVLSELLEICLSENEKKGSSNWDTCEQTAAARWLAVFVNKYSGSKTFLLYDCEI